MAEMRHRPRRGVAGRQATHLSLALRQAQGERPGGGRPHEAGDDIFCPSRHLGCAAHI